MKSSWSLGHKNGEHHTELHCIHTGLSLPSVHINIEIEATYLYFDIILLANALIQGDTAIKALHLTH